MKNNIITATIWLFIIAFVGMFAQSAYTQWQPPNYPVPPKGAYTDSVEVSNPLRGGTFIGDSLRVTDI